MKKLSLEGKEKLYEIYYKYIKQNLPKVVKNGKIVIFYSIIAEKEVVTGGHSIQIEIKHLTTSSITVKQDLRDIIFRPDFFEFWFLPKELKDIIGFENSKLINNGFKA